MDGEEYFVETGENYHENFFAGKVLQLSKDQETVLLSSLKHLLLGSISFNHYCKEMKHAFNVKALQSLTLHRCIGAADFLEEIINSGDELTLTSLEITDTCTDEMDVRTIQQVTGFLSSFQGIERLSVSLSIPVMAPYGPMSGLLESLLNHQSTLKRLVLHQKRMLQFNQSHLLCDVLDLALDLNDTRVWNETKDNLSKLSLEYLGLCIDPLYLQRILEPFASKSTLQVLHIRRQFTDFFKLQALPKLIRWHKYQDGPYPDDDTASNRHTQLELQHLQLSYELNKGTPKAVECLRQMSKLRRPNDDNFPEARRIIDHLFRFSNWAFRPNGIRSLKLIAFGDFSERQQYQESHIILCRDPKALLGFRSISEADYELQALVRDNMEFFEACPTWSPELE